MEDRTYSGIKLLPRVQEGTEFYLVASQHLSRPPRSIIFHRAIPCFILFNLQDTTCADFLTGLPPSSDLIKDVK